MSECPLCNNYETMEHECSSCGGKTEDCGRFMDFFDDYSPYLDIDGLKEIDGQPDLHSGCCPHYFYCPRCGMTEVVLIEEMHTLPHDS